jgi:predicted GIY-YIG superfamily endonuclease
MTLSRPDKMTHPPRVPTRVSIWSLYVLRCGDGSLYTGIAVDVAQRLAAHAAGRGARYTRGRGPLTLAAKTRCRDRSVALRAEHAFKQLTRAEKDAVLARPRGLAGFVRRTAR